MAGFIEEEEEQCSYTIIIDGSSLTLGYRYK
jgi:hypothetical protein